VRPDSAHLGDRVAVEQVMTSDVPWHLFYLLSPPGVSRFPDLPLRALLGRPRIMAGPTIVDIRDASAEE
jgi:hypothetical protein